MKTRIVKVENAYGDVHYLIERHIMFGIWLVVNDWFGPVISYSVADAEQWIVTDAERKLRRKLLRKKTYTVVK